MRWSTNETYQFVKIYLKHEVMWNPKHSCHRRKMERTKAMREICAEFRNKTGIALSESEAYMKVRVLQSTYSQELAKIKRRSDGDSSYTPKIKWFNEWHKCYDKKLKVLRETIEGNEEGPEELSEQYLWANTENENDDIDLFPDENYSHILKTEAEDMNEKPNIQLHKTIKTIPSSPSSISDRTFVDSASATEMVTKEDEFDIYGQYIASQLRKMDLEKALKVQLQIQTVVSEARISEISSCD